MAAVTRQQLRDLSELLPDGRPAAGRRALLRLARVSRRGGLAGVPERYQLQFLLLAAEVAPARTQAEVAALAGRAADRLRIPRRLVRQMRTDTRPLDEWLRDRAGDIRDMLADLAAG